MARFVYFVGAGLTKSLQLEQRVPLMMDFVNVLTDYIDNDIVLNTLLRLEGGRVYEAPCGECEHLAQEVSTAYVGRLHDVPKSTRNELSKLIRGRRPESIERLFERVDSMAQPNAEASGIECYFRYAINHVFASIGWELRLQTLERFLKGQFRSSDAQSKHVFVSFNYDLALDRAVERASERRWQPMDGYGFEFPCYITGVPTSDFPDGAAPGFPAAGLPRSRERFQILKPHGSLNWLRRQRNKRDLQDDLDDVGEMAVVLDAENDLSYWPSANTFNYISSCSAGEPARYEILIAPPSVTKPDLLPAILDLEFEAIKSADEIFVLGYSLPRSDRRQAALISAAMEARRKSLERLTIVSFQESADYFNKARSLFRPKTMRVYNDGFIDFASKVGG